jgi:hypothetical protein
MKAEYKNIMRTTYRVALLRGMLILQEMKELPIEANNEQS